MKRIIFFICLFLCFILIGCQTNEKENDFEINNDKTETNDDDSNDATDSIINQQTKIKIGCGHVLGDSECKNCGYQPYEMCLNFNPYSEIKDGEPTEYRVSAMENFSAKCTIIPEKYNDLPVTIIQSYGFEDCESLQSIFVPDSVKIVEYRAFLGCTSLEIVSMSSNVEYIGEEVFKYCTSLKYNEYGNALYLGNDKNAYITLVKANNTEITNCNINEKCRVICCESFLDCTKLENVVMHDDVITIGHSSFENCSNLENINLSNNITSIKEWTFKNCSKLAKITIPEGVVKIGSSSFRNCNSLKELVISKTVEIIAEDAFAYCTNLEIVKFPDGLKTVESDAFAYCTNLKIIVVSSSVTYIRGNAFYECLNLEVVYNDSDLVLSGLPASVKVYNKGEWAYISGIPTPNK